MALSLREYRARIKSVESTKKITRAMELIAASRIVKAQQRDQQAAPYARELTRAVQALVTYSNVTHPLNHGARERRQGRDPDRDQRPRAGRRLLLERAQGGRAPGRAPAGRRQGGRHLPHRTQGEAYFRLPQRPVAQSWTGFSDQPRYEDAKAIGESLIEDFTTDQGHDRHIDEVHLVYTQSSRCSYRSPTTSACCRWRSSRVGSGPDKDEVLPLYEFEPSAQEVLVALLPKYVQSRIVSLRAAAGLRPRSSHARQRAMKSGHGQRRRADQEVHPYRQPGPAGGHHPGDQ